MLPNTWPLAPRVAEKTATGTRSLHYFCEIRRHLCQLNPVMPALLFIFSQSIPESKVYL
jgi:hypothetical protein